MAGTTNVQAGGLKVDGSLASGAVNVASGASLSGAGSLGGAVTVANGGNLAATSGSTLNAGNLVLDSGANFNASLGTPSGGGSPLVNVANNLTLGGTLNVTDIGGFGAGVYRLFAYGGSLTNNGMSFGTTPVPI
ncbi:MAG: hypothetical protein H5U33_05655, partial [Pseudomonas sp.]|nr:hypothetical protein [Pseudomonas sp.]